jgi:hypothetical protein
MIIHTPMVTRQVPPMRVMIFCRLATLWVPEMSAAARPKKVFSPVAYTSASFSPCLTVEPEKATSPVYFFAGSDSPVRAAWSICSHRPHECQTLKINVWH